MGIGIEQGADQGSQRRVFARQCSKPRCALGFRQIEPLAEQRIGATEPVGGERVERGHMADGCGTWRDDNSISA